MADRAGALTGSVRFRITAIAVIVVVAVLGVAGLALVAVQRRVLTESLDDALLLDARSVATQITSSGAREPVLPRGDDDALVQVVAGRTVVVPATGRSRMAVPAGSAVGVGRVTRSTADLGLGRSHRLVALGVVGPGGELLTVYVATPMDDVEESARVLARSLLVVVPLVAAGLAVLVWWLIGRTLRPVEAIRAEVATIGASDLHRRVPEPATQDEIGRLARTMNAMLERIEEAAERQRRFVADASHELRTPLTRMRTVLEVDQAHPATADAAATERDVLSEVLVLQALVDGLLVLARSDALHEPVREPVHLQAVVDTEVRRAQRRARAGVVVQQATTGTEDDIEVHGEAASLGRVVDNLVDNALRHARSTVTVRLERRDGGAVLTVDDDGRGIPPDQREVVFERFTRLDEDRSAGTGGAGLGLAIALEIVTRSGGSIRAEEAEAGGGRFVVFLPCDPAGRPR